jgi:HEAT repeat protein
MGLIKQTPLETARGESRASSRDCPSLCKQLLSASPEVRRWAARDLVDCPDCSEALVAALHVESDASVREVMLTSITRIGDGIAVNGLVECLRSEEADLRNEAIEAMKQLPDAVAPIMLGLLMDEDSDVRIFAVNILESLRHPLVENWLLQVIDADDHVNVCGTAVDLLGEVGGTASLESLVRLKSRFADEPYIQYAADLAIKRIQEN